MLVLIRGAGDLATGIALRLFRSHLRVVMTDLPQPTAIRRTVCFSQAILYGSYQVEDVTAERAETEDDVRRILSAGQIPVLADPRAACRAWLRPDVVVDAILAKKEPRHRDHRCAARHRRRPRLLRGEGLPRGHRDHARPYPRPRHPHGRAYPEHEYPRPHRRLHRRARAARAGQRIFHQLADIGARVQAGDVVGEVNGKPMACTIAGVIRGMLADGTPVYKGMKSGDVDPRGELSYCYTASDKAIAIGGGVLQAILEYTGVLFECHGSKCMGGII